MWQVLFALRVRFDLNPLRFIKPATHQWRGVITEYRSWLPVTSKTPIITLREGGTPLVLARNLSERLNNEIWLKVEGANPTGSFKDRGMTMAISKAVEKGAQVVICASTGNTSASAAAYAAKANLKPVVLVPKGKIALGKLAQAIAHGAMLIQLNGNFDDCLKLARNLSAKYPVELVNSVNPFRIHGQKTASFEIIDKLGHAPDIHVLPVGNAGNITAYWQGYKEYKKRGRQLPKMWGFQAAGAAPIVINKIVKNPETIATAIRIGNPASWDSALAARKESGGVIEAVTDQEILEAYRLVAKTEGVFIEPSSAAGIAGLFKKQRQGKLPTGKCIVITVTGNGLKDTQTVLAKAPKPIVIPNNLSKAAAIIGLS